jgi:hypothetical protein
MMNLPTPQGTAVAASLVVVTQVLPRQVTGWRDNGH